LSISPRPAFTVPLAHGLSLELGPRTLVMGILNATPDSFAGGVTDPDLAVDLALRMEAEGADIIDIGGESTRPGAAPVSEADELARVVPVIERLQGRLRVPVSIDTYKAAVAGAAVAAGASIVNDISGLGYDPDLGDVVARTGSGLVLMHMRGRPRDMYREAGYGDVAAEVSAELQQALARADAAGVPRERVILDPGVGFAKQANQSRAVLVNLAVLSQLGRPLLVGPSRKSFLVDGQAPLPPAERDWSTAAAVTVSITGGAHIVRVHNVAAMVQVVRTADALRAAALAQSQAGKPIKSGQA
jgi:dihydropteroate synthase